MVNSNHSMDKFKGVFALVLTPFQAGGEIDWNVYDTYVDWQLSKRPNGLFAVCGSSEMLLLTLEERLALARRAVKRAKGTPVIATANVGANIADHLEELKRMTETGVSGVVLVPPAGLGADQAKLGEYFANLSDKAACPVFLYEYPALKPCHVDAAVYSDLVKHHGVRGIKDTTSTRDGIQAKIDAVPESIIYQANMSFMLDALQNGAEGIMTITSSSCAELVVELWEKVQAKDPSAAITHQQLVTLDAFLSLGYIATAKYLIALQGIPMNIYTRNNNGLSPSAAKAIEVWHEMNRDRRLSLGGV